MQLAQQPEAVPDPDELQEGTSGQVDVCKSCTSLGSCDLSHLLFSGTNDSPVLRSKITTFRGEAESHCGHSCSGVDLRHIRSDSTPAI